MTQNRPFKFFDCAPVFIATGIRAYTLRELVEGLRSVHEGSLHHHFWRRLLGTAVEEPEYSNDLAGWISRELRDPVLAERLSVIYPTDFESVEELREEIINVIEERLDEDLLSHTATAPQAFHFLRTQLVVFDTGVRATAPENLTETVPTVSDGSIYYHFIEARMRNPDGRDDFTRWLESLPEDRTVLCSNLSAIDPYFSSLGELRDRLFSLFQANCPVATDK